MLVDALLIVSVPATFEKAKRNHQEFQSNVSLHQEGKKILLSTESLGSFGHQVKDQNLWLLLTKGAEGASRHHFAVWHASTGSQLSLNQGDAGPRSIIHVRCQVLTQQEGLLLFLGTFPEPGVCSQSPDKSCLINWQLQSRESPSWAQITHLRTGWALLPGW